MDRKLNVREYVSELRGVGYIHDRPGLILPELPNSDLGLLSYINNTSSDFNQFGLLYPIDVVSRNKKGFIAKQKDTNSDRLRYVYFPNNLDHADIFSRSLVRAGGTSNLLPGNVAVLDVDCGSSTALINHLQVSFKDESPVELTRSLSRKYQGARYRLMDLFFQEFPDLDLIMLDCPSGEHLGSRNLIKEKCLANGFSDENYAYVR